MATELPFVPLPPRAWNASSWTCRPYAPQAGQELQHPNTSTREVSKDWTGMDELDMDGVNVAKPEFAYPTGRILNNSARYFE